MNFCIISPVAGLRRYSILSKTHLILPHIQNPEYVKFYQERKAAGDFLILDNGAYEFVDDWGSLVRGIEIYRPNVVALPDYLLQPWFKTWKATTEFLDRWYYTFPNVDWMYIPQSTKGDIWGFIEGLAQIQAEPRIKWVGLSRALGMHISNDPLMRVNTCDYLRKKGYNVHALGMMAGNLRELELLRKVGCRSIDSSAPVWRGWKGKYLNETSGKHCVPDVNFEEPLDTYHELLDPIIFANLEACGVDTSAAANPSPTGAGNNPQG